MGKINNTSVDKYATRTPEEWLHNFVEQYNDLKPSGAAEYNKRREKGTPPYQALMQMHGSNDWYEFLKLANVFRYKNGKRYFDVDNIVLKVTSHNDLLLKVMQQFNCISIEEFLESGKVRRI